MSYFSSIKTKEELKAKFKELAFKMHPDKGGDHEAYIRMKTEYDHWTPAVERVTYADTVNSGINNFRDAAMRAQRASEFRQPKRKSPEQQQREQEAEFRRARTARAQAFMDKMQQDPLGAKLQSIYQQCMYGPLAHISTRKDLNERAVRMKWFMDNMFDIPDLKEDHFRYIGVFEGWTSAQNLTKYYNYIRFRNAEEERKEKEKKEAYGSFG